MSPERLNNLSGHSVLIVESKEICGQMFAEAYVNHDMKPVEASENVPDDLLGYMNKQKIESAIIHTASPQDEAQILNAHKAGKKIILIKRNPPCSTDEAKMYSRLEKAGILTMPKRFLSQTESFELLSTLFK